MSAEERVVALLLQKGMHIAFAESCTGGLCSAALIGVPDASGVLSESYVTYSEESKSRILGIPAEFINDHGVVSREVAGAMAEGVCKAAECEVGVGITGYAGPSGGDAIAPIGTVCFGFCIYGTVHTWRCDFGPIGRNDVRETAKEFVFQALAELLA